VRRRTTNRAHSEGQRGAACDQRGFTFVETLVVVLILGVLAAVVVFSVGDITHHGQNTSCQAEVREVRTAIGVWKAVNKGNPASLTVVMNAGLLKSVPSKTATPPSPSAVAGYTYSRATGTYDLAAGQPGCPTG
jgi:prepilin-type N-terminal cleavage/methylation domain-containing protein